MDGRNGVWPKEPPGLRLPSWSGWNHIFYAGILKLTSDRVSLQFVRRLYSVTISMGYHYGNIVKHALGSNSVSYARSVPLSILSLLPTPN